MAPPAGSLRAVSARGPKVAPSHSVRVCRSEARRTRSSMEADAAGDCTVLLAGEGTGAYEGTPFTGVLIGVVLMLLGPFCCCSRAIRALLGNEGVGTSAVTAA